LGGKRKLHNIVQRHPPTFDPRLGEARFAKVLSNGLDSLLLCRQQVLRKEIIR